MSKSTNVFIGAMSAGFLLGVLLAPVKGKVLCQILFNHESDATYEEDAIETYNINELVSADSISFEDLRAKIKNG